MTVRFAAPTTVADALAILAGDPAAGIVAGGTDLVVAARQGRRPLPETIVAIDRITELAATTVSGPGLRLGALTSHAWVAGSDEVRSGWSALADASALVGSPATRSTGTIGGNLMNASPAADTTAPLVAFDATAVLASADGSRRSIPVAELATGPGRTAAAADELLVRLDLPAITRRHGSAYVRLEYRRAMEIAIVGAAVVVVLGGDDPAASIVDARVALTAVAPTVFRVAAAEASLVGTAGDEAAWRAAGAAAASASSPIDDVRATADYRRAMVDVVVARAVAAAVRRAREGAGAVPVPASRWASGRVI